MKDEELKLEEIEEIKLVEIEASHTLGGAGEVVRGEGRGVRGCRCKIDISIIDISICVSKYLNIDIDISISGRCYQLSIKSLLISYEQDC
jgi:hypothetical protein